MARIYSTLFAIERTVQNVWTDIGGDPAPGTFVIREIHIQIPSGVNPDIEFIFGIGEIPASEDPIGILQLTSGEVFDAYANQSWEGRIVIPPGYSFAYYDTSFGGTPGLYVGGYNLSP